MVHCYMVCVSWLGNSDSQFELALNLVSLHLIFEELNAFFQIEVGEVGALRALVAFAASCDKREGVWGAISACAAGSWGTSSAETFAVEVVRAGVKCMGKVNSSVAYLLQMRCFTLNLQQQLRITSTLMPRYSSGCI
jgi:hypothetical protein